MPTLYKYILIPCFILLLSSPSINSHDFMYDLQHGSLDKKITAMHHLGYSRNKKAFWHLVKYLKYDTESNSPTSRLAREAAAEALGRLQDERAVKHLISQWEIEKSDKVKAKIIFALRYYRDKNILAVLKQALTSDDESILFQALLTSSRYNNSELTPEIQTIKSNSKNSLLQLSAAFSLISLKTDISQNSDFLKNSLISEDPEMRFWAAYFLAEADAVDSIDDIIKANQIENTKWIDVQQQKSIFSLRMTQKKRKEAANRNHYEVIVNGD